LPSANGSTFEANDKKTCAFRSAGCGDDSHPRRLKQVGAVELLMMDDCGLTPLSEEQQADLYEIISIRYKRVLPFSPPKEIFRMADGVL
jgi:hypothetical protein